MFNELWVVLVPVWFGLHSFTPGSTMKVICPGSCFPLVNMNTCATYLNSPQGPESSWAPWNIVQGHPVVKQTTSDKNKCLLDRSLHFFDDLFTATVAEKFSMSLKSSCRWPLLFAVKYAHPYLLMMYVSSHMPITQIS